jgi:tellurite resistance protein
LVGDTHARRPAVEMEVMMIAPRSPLNFFGIPFGLAGLAGSWVTMADYGHVPDAVGDVLLGLSALVWLIVLGAYLRYVLSDRTALVRDLLDPIGAPFASLAAITPILLANEGVYPQEQPPESREPSGRKPLKSGRLSG